MKVLGPLAKDIIYNWSLTQSLSITEQLTKGIRYFDLRIGKKQNSEDLFLLHGLYGNKLEEILEEIKAYMDDHPKEVVLLDLNHFYNMTEFDHKQCMSMILEILGYKMCPLLDMESVTLDILWDSNLQALVFYHSSIAVDNHQFWPGSSIPSPWPNVCDVKKMLSYLEARYKQPRDKNHFYVTQGILTPDAGCIITHLAGSLKSAIAEKTSKPFVQWLSQKQSGSQGINICILDYVELADYIPRVLALNNTII